LLPELAAMVFEYHDIKSWVKSITTDFLYEALGDIYYKIFDIDYIVDKSLSTFEMVIQYIVENYNNQRPLLQETQFSQERRAMWTHIYDTIFDRNHGYIFINLYPILDGMISTFYPHTRGPAETFIHQREWKYLMRLDNFACGSA
jgi:hypothetical protein